MPFSDGQSKPRNTPNTRKEWILRIMTFPRVSRIWRFKMPFVRMLEQSKYWALALSALAALNSSRADLMFNIVPETGTPQYVVDAFNLAAARWSAVLANPITVNIDLGWSSLGSGVLGQTTPTFVQQNYAAVTAALNASASSADDQSAYAHLQSGSTYSRLINHTTDNPNGANSGTPYVNSLTPVTITRANARALGLVGASSSSDARIQFNSNAAFDFNPADGTTSSQFDFVTVAAHELGHALGFVSVVNQIEQQGGAAGQLPSSILDLFRFSAESVAAGQGFGDATADGRDKYFSVDGGISAAGPFANGAIYGSGYQADHWREWSFTGLMDAQSFLGLQRRIGPHDLQGFDVLGYTIPEPGTGALLILGMLLRWHRMTKLKGESSPLGRR